MTLEELSGYYYLSTAGISSSKIIPHYSISPFSERIAAAKKEGKNAILDIETILNPHKFTVWQPTLTSLLDSKIEAWTLLFKSVEDAEMYRLVKMMVTMSSKQISTWDDSRSWAAVLNSARWYSDFVCHPKDIKKIYLYMLENYPEFVLHPKLATMAKEDEDVILIADEDLEKFTGHDLFYV